MNEQDLTQKVIAIITAQQKLAPGQVTADSTFADLNIDSLDGVNLLFAFEEEFNITIPEHIAQQMKDVRQVAAGLRQVLDKRDAAQATVTTATEAAPAPERPAPAGVAGPSSQKTAGP